MFHVMKFGRYSVATVDEKKERGYNRNVVLVVRKGLKKLTGMKNTGYKVLEIFILLVRGN